LQQDPAGEEKRVGRGIDHGAAGAADSQRAGDVVKAGGVGVEPHVAVIGFNEHVVDASGNLQMAFGFQVGSGLVIDHLVGAEDVIAVVDLNVAGEGPQIADAGLALRLPADRHSGRAHLLWLGDGQNFLAGIVGELRTGGVNG
jgi:hypothetical protein